MSRRELKALLSDKREKSRTGTRSGRTTVVMNEETDEVARLKADLATARRAVEEKDRELSELRTAIDHTNAEAAGAKAEAEKHSLTVRTLERDLENERLRADLAMLRALENLRSEHRDELEREKEQMKEERKRMEQWMNDVKESFQRDKEHMQKRIADLEEGPRDERPRVPVVGGVSASSTHAHSDSTRDAESDSSEGTARTSEDTVGPGDGTTTPLADGGSGVVVESEGAVASEERREAEPRDQVELLQSVTQLLQAQTQAMVAQAQATAAQYLPPLSCYTGEGSDVADDGFDRWIERFKERAKIAGWTGEQQLYQLKVHLEKTAGEVFRMLPETDRENLDDAVSALRKRFKPADIEELRGL